MFLNVLKTAIEQWFRHRSARLGAALAYYSVFSMGPLLLIVTSVAGLFFGADAAAVSPCSSAMLGEVPALYSSSWPPWEWWCSSGRHEHHLERGGTQGGGRVVVRTISSLSPAFSGLASCWRFRWL